ncbi:PglZ domain-containing protein [Polaribacter sp. 11A2H]|uniref:PglZ domain-containing protein n=1 Tax=Polaribacter sp. 11A2H TaxID=2687290 RepID=UPI00140CABAD|nr:PglZ domain-containing protein [Polaribacter sp. 11A2H]
MIKEYIKKYLLDKIDRKHSLVIYDSNLFYRDLVLELATENIKVFDASKNVITEREAALDYWVNEIPKQNDKKLIFYVPFDKKIEDDEKATDPFLIFTGGGVIFPDEASDDYKQICLAALPDKTAKVEAIFSHEKFPSFNKIDALDGGNSYPSLKSGLGAQSQAEILLAFLNPTDQQLAFLKTDKSWSSELKQFLKESLGFKVTSKKVETIQNHLWRIVLFSEFVFDLPVELPKSLKEVSIAKEESKDVIFKVCNQLRSLKDTEELYIINANRVSDELGLGKLFNAENNLGEINTFAFEDSSFFIQFKNELLKRNFNKAKTLAETSSKSIWSIYDDERRAAWQLGNKICELLKCIEAESDKIKKIDSLKKIINWYTSSGFNLDSLQREIEKGVQNEIVISPNLTEVIAFGRKEYHLFMDDVQKKFQKGIETEGVSNINIQRNISLFNDKVKPLIDNGKKTVYILADALRFELAVFLKNRLDRADFDCNLEPSLAFIPTITKYGMAALMPEADKNLELKLVNNKLEPFLKGTPSGNRKDRIKYTEGLLGDKSAWYWEKDILNDQFEEKDILFVTTTEIDQAGENSPENAQALIDSAIHKILKVCAKLKEKGYEEFVLVADHGFVLVDSFKAGNNATKPPGDWSLEKSRCVVGTGDTSSNHILMSNEDLGIKSESKQFLFLKNYATYERGKKFFHEGLSLQECITPLLTFRPKRIETKQDYQINLTYKGKVSGYVTTRRPSIEISCFGDSFFDEPIDIMLEAIGDNKFIGGPAASENVNSTSGFAEIKPGQSLKITMSLHDDFEGKFTIYAKAPATGVILSEINLETDYL